MIQVVLFTLAALAMLVLGAAIGYLYSHKSSVKKEDFDQISNEKSALAQEKIEQSNKITQLETSLKHYEASLAAKKETIKASESELTIAKSALAASREKITLLTEQHAEKIAEIKEIQEAFKNQLKILSQDVLSSHTAKFKQDSQEHLSQILKPFKENIDAFRTQVEKSFEKHGTEQTTLKTEIKNIMDAHQQISDQTKNLTKALRGDSKTQGNWGEVMLEKILEESGLRKGDDYITQGQDLKMKNPETGGVSKPDIVIKLPEGKHIIVDSKVSLTSYELHCSAETADEKDLQLKAFLQSMKNHITGLESKRYQDTQQVDSLDFVLMFVPIEGALALALQNDQTLFNYAWNKRIIIVSPTTLLATLRTIASIRRLELQNKNALKIAQAGGALYDKVVGFATDMNKMGSQLNTVQTTYNNAIKKLSEGPGNIIKKTQDLKELGAKTSKNLIKTMPTAFIEEDITEDGAVGCENKD